MKRKSLFCLLFLVLFVPAVVCADQTELAIESSTDSVSVGDTFEVNLLSFNSSCDGFINTTLKYDSTILELVSDNTGKYTIGKDVESNVNGSYTVTYEYNSCAMTEGIPTIASYSFKVKSGNVDTTEVTIDSYGTSKTVNVSIEKSNVVDDTNDSNRNDNEDINVDQNNQADDNVKLMNYVIVALLGTIAVLLVVLICVIVFTNKKLNRQ